MRRDTFKEEKKMENPKKPIYLDDDSILQRSLFPEEYAHNYVMLKKLAEYDGSTKIVNYIGTDVLSDTFEEYGPYKVIAIAEKYEAKISHLSQRMMKKRSEPPSQEPKDEILFSGSITIYKRAPDLPREMNIYDLKRIGLIWAAVPQMDLYYESDGLKHLLFGRRRGNWETIDAILEGYELQEEKRMMDQMIKERRG
jgi:hypothetical protein